MESDLTDKLAVLSHPQRLAIFRLLVRRCPDALPAGEIAQALGLKASTASVYLSSLTRAGLITRTRQGTSLRYTLDAPGAQAMVSNLLLDCCRGRPELCPPNTAAPAHDPDPVPHRKYNVLFVCTGNSARSIFAEALLRELGGDRFHACSAGTQPQPALSPMTVETLATHGLPTEDLRAKSVAEFQGADAPKLDFVFTVCDRAANEDCPAWQGQPICAHWGLPDPAQAAGTEAEQRRAFQQTFAMMRHRIIDFTALPVRALDRISLQHEVDEIGREKETT